MAGDASETRRGARLAIAAALVAIPLLVAVEGAIERPRGTAATSAARSARPNILLIVAEDMSARVGAFGDPVAVTPHLDRLAAEGTRYPNTFATSSACATSRAALMLGMHQVAVGAQHMRTASRPGGAYMTVPPPHVKAFPELLRAAGYYTFNRLKLDYQFSRLTPGTGPFTIWDAEWGYTDLAALREWRRRPQGRPFFGNYNLMATHESGLYPPLGNMPQSAFHLEMQLYRAFLFGWIDGPVAPRDVVLEPYLADTPDARATLARHYNNIHYMDAEVGEILADLESDGLLDDTVVIWTTDHGDGLPRAKRDLYDAGIRVPMIVRWPARFRPPGATPGGVDERLISFVDLTATILRLAGVAPPRHMHGRDFRSSTRRYVFASGDRVDRIDDRQRAVRDRRYKYIRSWRPELAGAYHSPHRDPIPLVSELLALHDAGRLRGAQEVWFRPNGDERLFDLQTDPHELDNLAAVPRHAATLARLRGALDDWMARVGDDGAESEEILAQRFWPDGVQPQTPPPAISVGEAGVRLSCGEAGASLGYRVDGGDWQLYTAPFEVAPGQTVYAKAVRYGWAESRVVTRTP